MYVLLFFIDHTNERLFSKTTEFQNVSILNLSFEITTENIANQRNTPLGLSNKVGNWHDNFTGYDDNYRDGDINGSVL